jgi:asparagine synthase (glutamine-hydrolysing)
MRQAVHRCRQGDGPEGVLLSGGMDSRAVLAAMDGPRGSVHTFTFGIPGCDDVRLAREVAAKAGTRHHYVPLRPEDLPRMVEEGVRLGDGLNSVVHMHVLAALPEAARQVRVVYTGSLGDSIMGQHLHRSLMGIHPEEVLVRMLFRHYTTAFSEERMVQLLDPTVYRGVQEVPFETFRRALQTSRATLSANRREHYSIRQNERRWILEGQRLLRSRLVVRTPFYDTDLVDFMVRVPPGLRMEGYLYRRAFAVAFPDLAKVPLEETGEPLVPCMRGAVIRLRRQLRWWLRAAGLRFVSPPRRRPYADYNGWMRTVLRPWVERILLSDQALGRGFFNPEAVRALVEEHMSGEDHARRLGVLLTFELWCRQFLDGDGGVEG